MIYGSVPVNYLRKQPDFIVNNNADGFFSNFIGNCTDTNEKDTWIGLSNFLKDPNNQFSNSIENRMGYGVVKLNHEGTMDVNHNQMLFGGVVPIPSSRFQNSDSSMNIGHTASINMSNPQCFGGSPIKNAASTSMFNYGMPAAQAFDGRSRTVTPGSVLCNTGFPISANGVQPNFQNNPEATHLLGTQYNNPHTSNCGTFLQPQGYTSVPQRFPVMNQSNGFQIPHCNPWEGQPLVAVESSSHNCIGFNCNICGPGPVTFGMPSRKRKFDFAGPGNDLIESRSRNNYESWVDSGTLFDVLASSYMPVDLPPLEEWPNSSEDGPDFMEIGPVLTQPARNESSGTLMDVYTSFIKSSASTKDAKPDSEDALGPNVNEVLREEKVICRLNSALDDYESVLESMRSIEPCVLESEKTSTPITSFEDNGSGLGSGNVKKLSASLTDSLTAAQIKEHLSSFIQPQKDVSGGTEPSESQNLCQLCSKNKLLLAPTPVYCSSCDVRIKQNVKYYRSTDENTKTQHCICIGCFKGSRGSSVITRGGSVSKTVLHMAMNDEEIEDSWVQCDTCQQWQHRICGLYNNETDLEGKAEYVCPKCCLKETENGTRISLLKTVLGAKELLLTDLSDHIEQRLFTRMKQEREETAKVLGIASEEVPVAEGLVVRVVVSVDKELEVKKQFRDIFNGQDYPEKIEYRSKLILLFQKIGGVDVCLFGMYVQEFGSECNGPNNRCVYISYIDSVKYFQPERKTASGEPLRTFVYHEILIGYLEHCKKRGFASCYIWSCPVIKGEDYIFYCHPKTQKTPEKTKLRQWYKLMIRKAVKDGIVVDQTNLYNEFFATSNVNVSAARLPYFDGDCWSDAAINISKKLDDEESSGGKLCVKSRAKRISMVNGDESLTKDALVMNKLGEIIMHDKENYMIVRLQHTCTSCNQVILSGSRWCCNQCNKIQLCPRCVSPSRMHKCGSCKDKPLSEDVLMSYIPVDTKDKDDVLVNKLFETRDDFLNKCQNSLYQFDTLGHAKYSTMMILYHYNHNLVVQPKGDTCHTGNLIHPPTDVTPVTRTEEQPQDQNQETVTRALDALNHASLCKSVEGCNPDCRTIKILLQHVSICTTRKHNGCQNCRGAWWVLEKHINTCTKLDCTIPYCKYIREERANTCQRSEFNKVTS
ncbi:putative histone acetyltransferase chromatin regulator PHD family [Helianthus annuus]|nr:putative histone acetyltransferase chromatin regulator PHD family [Helianthus annuus]